MRKPLASIVLLVSILGSLFAHLPLFTTWAQVPPAGIECDVGDPASIERALISVVSDAREQMRAFYAPSIHWLSLGFVAPSACAAWLLLHQPVRQRGTPSAMIPPN